MDAIQPILNDILAVLREGYGAINASRGLLIALAATIFMQSWRQWLPIGLVAVLIDIGVDVIAPVLGGGGELRLPPLMEASFWRHSGVLFVGYLIVIAIFFFIKRLLLRGGKPAKAH